MLEKTSNTIKSNHQTITSTPTNPPVGALQHPAPTASILKEIHTFHAYVCLMHKVWNRELSPCEQCHTLEKSC